MNADLRIVDPSEVRNAGAGDWYFKKYGTSDESFICCRSTGDPDSDFLILLHELFECYQCQRNGVTEDSVNEFDKTFTGPGDEPGHSQDAPYHLEHENAMKLEQYAAHLLRVPWRKHEKRIDRMLETK